MIAVRVIWVWCHIDAVVVYCVLSRVWPTHLANSHIIYWKYIYFLYGDVTFGCFVKVLTFQEQVVQTFTETMFSCNEQDFVYWRPKRSYTLIEEYRPLLDVGVLIPWSVAMLISLGISLKVFSVLVIPRLFTLLCRWPISQSQSKTCFHLFIHP